MWECVCILPVCVCVCVSVYWIGLHVCAGARWSVSWLALAGELEESRGERGDLQKRHAPLPPLLLFLFLLLLLRLCLSQLLLLPSLFQPSSSSPTFTLSALCLLRHCLSHLKLFTSSRSNAQRRNQMVFMQLLSLHKRLLRLNLCNWGTFWACSLYIPCRITTHHKTQGQKKHSVFLVMPF